MAQAPSRGPGPLPDLRHRQGPGRVVYARYARLDRAVWRDLDALLLQDTGPGASTAAGRVHRRFPACPHEVAAGLRVRAFGFDQDGQTIDRQWFTAATPPVLALDGQDGYRYGYSIKAAREAAERVGPEPAAGAAAGVGRDRCRGRPVGARGMTRYWADAEERFWQMVAPAETSAIPDNGFIRIAVAAFEDVTGQHAAARPAGDPRHRESTRRDLRILGPRLKPSIRGPKVPDSDLIMKKAEELVREVRQLLGSPADRAALRHSLGHAPEEAALAVHRIVSRTCPTGSPMRRPNAPFTPSPPTSPPSRGRHATRTRPPGRTRRPRTAGRTSGNPWPAPPSCARAWTPAAGSDARLQLLARQDLSGLYRQLPRLVLHLRAQPGPDRLAGADPGPGPVGPRPEAGRQGMDAVLLPHQRTADRGEETPRCGRRHDRQGNEET